MSSEKTEQPTPRRLRKARETGDVPVSAALNQTAALAAAVVLLPTAVQMTFEGFRRSITVALEGQAPVAWDSLRWVLTVTTPLLLSAAVAAAAFGVAQTGGLVAPKRLVPKFETLDPVSGLQKLLSADRVFQVLRALVTAGLLAWLCFDFLRDHAPSLVATTGDAGQAASLAGLLVGRLLWIALGISCAMAAIDVALTRRSWLKRNRMSKDEVKLEYRESEGDPALKQERKRAHQEMLDNASVLALRNASVLIVNPTHLATALRYDADGEGAPAVVAQGEGAFAQRLITAARAYGVSVVRDIPVARALRELRVGDEIPEELYEAVAEILKELWEHGDGETPIEG
jgi:flagellar biosynthesis protein FlhB